MAPGGGLLLERSKHLPANMQTTLHDAPRAAILREDLRLGWGPIDAVHDEFVELLKALLTAADETIPAAVAAIEQHSREHFASEERSMLETSFPASACHADEHAAVLASIAGVHRKVAAGDLEAGRRLASALADWFPGHVDHLDSALAHWICHKRLGGRPIVFRRPARPINA